ncbi:MAG: hypothetical protein ACR2GI_05835 [Thermomicrobiales bacterium]
MSTHRLHIPRVGRFGHGWPRLAVLHLLTRGVLGSTALVIGAGSLYGVLQGWASFDATGDWGDFEILKQFGMVQAIPALIAAVIGVSAWSPFGEYERTAARSMPRLRLLHIGILLALGLGVSAAYLTLWTSRTPEVDLALIATRNLLGMTGAALMLGRWADARISWLAPVTLAAIAVFNAMNGPPEKIWSPALWIWNGQAPTANESWAIAMTIFVAGGALFLRDGARDASGEEE